jgi:DNA-binding MarR family transcriptional regulator
VSRSFGGPAVVRDELVRLLQRYSVEAGRLGRAFAERHGLHPTDWTALLAVIQADRLGAPLTPGELGQRLGMSSGATTAVVDRLERGGHVRRVRDERDRRRLTLHRAAGAPPLLSAFLEPLNKAMDALLAGYSVAEAAVVQRFLADAVALLVDHRRRIVGQEPVDCVDQLSGGSVTAISPPSA